MKNGIAVATVATWKYLRVNKYLNFFLSILSFNNNGYKLLSLQYT